MSERRAYWTFGWLLLLVTPTAASADENDVCVVARTEHVDALSTIGLVAVGLPARLASLPAAAAALWNEAPCAASGRPRIVLDQGDRVLTVRWFAGASETLPGVCGSFAGREIRLWAFARVDGSLRRCGELERLTEILAHELGHALGLLDQRSPACGERIMGQLVRRADGSIAARRVHAEECAAASLHFVTLSERLERERRGDLQVAAIGHGPWSAAALP